MRPLLEEHRGIEDLRSREHVDARHIEQRAGIDGRQHGLEVLLVETERRGASAHLHRAAPRGRDRVDAHRHRHAAAEPCRDPLDVLDLFEGLQMDLADPRLDRERELVGALARPGEQHALRRAAGGSGAQKLRTRRDLQSRALLDEQGRDGGIGIGLDRVVDLGKSRHRAAQAAVAAPHHVAVVGEERRAVGARQLAGRYAADIELALAAGEIVGDQRPRKVARGGEDRLGHQVLSATRRL